MKLTRQRRMRLWGEFQTVRNTGQSAAGRYLVIGTLEDSSSRDRNFGLITSKKVGNAVTRNFVRRRLRDIIRKFRGKYKMIVKHMHVKQKSCIYS